MSADSKSALASAQSAAASASTAAQAAERLTATDALYAKPAVDDDGTPTLVTTTTETRVLTPEAARAAYSPVEDALFIPAKAMDPAEGTAPTYGSVTVGGHVSGWLLDDGGIANNEAVTFLFTVPDHWTKIVTIEPSWVALTAAGGNVVWSMNVFNLAHNVGPTSGGGSTLTSLGSSAGTTADRIRLTTVAANFTVDPVKVQRMILRRAGSNASDTTVGDIALIGVRIVGSA